ncbi:MAG: FecCD family ABC transporter permease [Coprobacillaceae bacterium]
MKSYRIVLWSCIILLVGGCIASLMIGTYQVSFLEIIGLLTGTASKAAKVVIVDLRLPRICIAIVVGIALSTCGSILQTVTRNSLAEPGVIGINGGAALAVTILIAMQSGFYYNNLGLFTVLLIPIVAIIGAFVSTAIIYALSYRKGVSPVRLLLVGIGINTAINAIIMVMQLSLSKGNYNQVLTWTSGSLWGSGWQYVWISAPLILILFIIAMYKAKTLDVMSLDEPLVVSLGISIEKERRQLLILAVSCAALATAVAGNISFLGILGPQIAKRLVGATHRKQIPVGALISALIIIVADIASRNLFSPLEIPVGIMISILGVPYFIFLMMKEK